MLGFGKDTKRYNILKLRYTFPGFLVPSLRGLFGKRPLDGQIYPGIIFCIPWVITMEIAVTLTV
jgi:hypothetical protein